VILKIFSLLNGPNDVRYGVTLITVFCLASEVIFSVLLIHELSPSTLVTSNLAPWGWLWRTLEPTYGQGQAVGSLARTLWSIISPLDTGSETTINNTLQVLVDKLLKTDLKSIAAASVSYMCWEHIWVVKWSLKFCSIFVFCTEMQLYFV